MSEFHKLPIKNVNQETNDCVSIAFEVPENLKSEFEFTQGQYLTFKINYEGEELRRSYSICTSPFDNELAIAVKRIPKGKISNFLNEKANQLDTLEVMPPTGSFFAELNSSNKKHYVAFAAGSGITPIMSIVKATLDKEPESKFTLFYGNKTPDTVIFKEELDKLAADHERFNLVNIYSRFNTGDDLLNGRIDTNKAMKLIDKYVTDDLSKEFFMCGPEEMTLGVSEKLKENYDNNSIHIELFTTPVQKEQPMKTTTASGVSKVTVIIDGEETELEIDKNGDAILDAALDAGLDVPFACKGAVCCTCKAKIIEGDVEMDMNYALSDAEIDEGFALTCQSHPRSEKVVVDYDEI